MGSIFHTVIYEDMVVKNLEVIKTAGYNIVCADIIGENVFNYKPKARSLLVLSSESHGPSKKVLKLSDSKITIPKIGTAESLNVASASAVILAEITK
jgi:TrmH family RNA methyltransferase